MINQPETKGTQPQGGKLILPAYSQQVPPASQDSLASPASPAFPNPEHHAASRNTANSHQPQITFDQLIHRTTTPPPKNLLARLGYFWQKDPAYKVLVIAVVLVLIASLVFVSLISNSLLRNPRILTIGDTFSQNPPTVVVPTGTVDLRPTFPPPAGGSGSTSSSQPPTQGTPALSLTPDSTPSTDPTPNPGGLLTITITDIPAHVANHSVVNVSVTSLPNVTVTLGAFYNSPPYKYSSASAITDGNGNAVLSWSVTVIMFGRNTRATVYVTARDQSGQRAQSQAVTVQITNNGG